MRKESDLCLPPLLRYSLEIFDFSSFPTKMNRCWGKKKKKTKGCCCLISSLQGMSCWTLSNQLALLFYVSSSDPTFSFLCQKWLPCCGTKIKVLLCSLRQREERLRHKQHFVKLGWILSTHLVSWESDHTERQRTEPSSFLELGSVSLVCISTIPVYVKYSAIQTGGQPGCQQWEEIKMRWSLVFSPSPDHPQFHSLEVWVSVQRVNLGSKTSLWVGLAVREGTSMLIHGWAVNCTENDHIDHLGNAPLNRQISSIVRTLSGVHIGWDHHPSRQGWKIDGVFYFYFFSSVLHSTFGILMLLETWTEELTSGCCWLQCPSVILQLTLIHSELKTSLSFVILLLDMA